MILENSISWCDETGNKVTGCDKVSPGCKNCYAQVGTRARVLRAQGIETWGPKGQRHPVADFSKKVRRLNKFCICDKCHKTHPVALLSTQTLQGGKNRPTWCFQCGGALRRIRIFADSNSDWLDDKWPIETLADLLKDIHDCPNIDFQLLTKRPENWRSRMDAALVFIECEMVGNFDRDELEQLLDSWLDCVDMPERGDIPQNIWIGTSVEDQARADERIPLLLQIPAKVRFLSVEPLLSPVDLTPYFYETAKHREHRISNASVSDRARRNSLERRQAGGEPYQQSLPTSTCDDSRNPAPLACSQIGMEALQRGNTARYGDQSQERNKIGQQAGKSGSGDVFAKHSSCSQGSSGRQSEPERGKKPHGETDGCAGDSDSQAEGSRGTAEGNSGGLRNQRQECIEDRASASVEIHWCIVGAESGPQRRDCGVEVICDVARQCVAAGVPCFVKQASAFKPGQRGDLPDDIWNLKQFPTL